MVGLSNCSAIVYGVIIGIIGIAGWQIMFKLCQKVPKMDCVGVLYPAPFCPYCILVCYGVVL